MEKVDPLFIEEILTLGTEQQVLTLQTLPALESIRILQKFPRKHSISLWPLFAKDYLYEMFLVAPRALKIEILEALPPSWLSHLWSATPSTMKRKLFNQLNMNLRNQLEQFQIYPAGTAGALMDSDIVTLQEDMQVNKALQKIKRSGQKQTRIFYVLDHHHRLTGYIDVADLALSESKELVDKHVHPIPIKINPFEKQDDLVELASSTELKSLPVIDDEDIFLGAVRSSDLLIASREEATADMQQMVGVNKEERALSTARFSISKRLPWLQINLLTAFLASAVVGLFEHTIAQFTALAVLLPVVAGQSGNTGAQALAVTMRGLALNEITLRHSTRIILKEAFVALVNGISVAATSALGVYIWSKDGGLALIIAISMTLSMIIAAIAGTSVPLLLQRLGQDPAQASTIILTTITDVVGFFTFLGIASSFSWLL